MASLRISSMAFARRTIARPSAARQAFVGLETRSFGMTSRLSKDGPLTTDSSVKSDQYPDDQHATDKTDKLDIQSENSSKGREAKSQGTGGQATTQSDTRNNTQRAKEEHPEAPDVVIGMQDERGGKGH